VTRAEERRIAALVRREVAALLRELLPALEGAAAERLDVEDWDAEVPGPAAPEDEEPGWSEVLASAGMSGAENRPPAPPPPSPPVPDAVAAWLREALLLDGLGTAAADRMLRHLRNGGLLEEANHRRAKRGLPPFNEDGTVRRDA